MLWTVLKNPLRTNNWPPCWASNFWKKWNYQYSGRLKTHLQSIESTWATIPGPTPHVSEKPPFCTFHWWALDEQFVEWWVISWAHPMQASLSRLQDIPTTCCSIQWSFHATCKLTLSVAGWWWCIGCDWWRLNISVKFSSVHRFLHELYSWCVTQPSRKGLLQ